MSTPSFKEHWSYIFNLLKKRPLSIVIMVSMSLIWSLSLSINPYLMKIIINTLTVTSDAQTFTAVTGPIALYLAMHITLETSYVAYSYYIDVVLIPSLRKVIATDIIDRLLGKHHSYYQTNFSGSLTNKLNDVTRSIPEMIKVINERFLSNLLALLFAIITLWQVNKLFAYLILAWSTLFISGTLLYTPHLTDLADRWSERGSSITGAIADVLSNILSVKLFTSQSIEKGFLHTAFQHSVEAEKKLQLACLWLGLGYGISTFILQSLNFYLLCLGRTQGWITSGDFALVMAVNYTICDLLWRVARDFSQFSKLDGCIIQALRTLLEPSPSIDSDSASPLQITEGEIRFSKVKFSYGEAASLFYNKSVTIKPGEKVGLVGYSGCGKTTFVNLILRLYDLDEGHIYIDEQDIQKVTQESLLASIGMIPQDPLLFQRSIMENIRYGASGASREEVIEAAKRAHAHEFIMQLADGYETLAGEKGTLLSGGQRQRIAIARAILKNAPILILDEATSQLDSITEKNIQDSLENLMRNKTSLVIAHRLSTLLRMDRILVFDKGQIVADGTHESLIKQNGLYKSLWDAQIGGFLADYSENK